jgi:hypothetical protein
MPPRRAAVDQIPDYHRAGRIGQLSSLRGSLVSIRGKALDTSGA